MWEISPTLVRYDVTEPTSLEVASAGLVTLAAQTKTAKISGAPFTRPIQNFYQTDVISRKYDFHSPLWHHLLTPLKVLSPWRNVHERL